MIETPVTRAEFKSAITLLQAIAEAIRELKQVSAAHLYAQVMGALELEQFERIINTLVDTGLVERRRDLLVWKEPAGRTAANHAKTPNGR